MSKLKFYDVKKKRSFTTDKYDVIKWRTKRGTFEVARARSPWGNTCYRVLRRVK